MAHFLGTELWSEIARLSRSTEPKQVVVPYYTSDADIRCIAGDAIVVDAAEATIAGGQTSAALLLDAVKRGAIVYSHPNVHAKILLVGGSAIVSSANLSANSRLLREAGVVFKDSDAVRRVSDYVNILRTEAARLNQEDLERLATIPVVATAHRLLRKPSVLEALAADLPLLADVAFGVYGGSTALTTAQVRESARSRALHLPTRWTWFESDDRPGVVARLKYLCADRPLVNFSVTFDREGCIKRFRRLDPKARPFLDAFRLRGSVVSVFGAPGFATPLDLNLQREELVQSLTRGLSRASQSLVLRMSNEEGVLAPADLRRLYELGR